jgi:hypothetical protein
MSGEVQTLCSEKIVKQEITKEEESGTGIKRIRQRKTQTVLELQRKTYGHHDVHLVRGYLCGDHLYSATE